MNTQEYISSGIIESYVLGLASPEEQREFEQICAQHPEVLQARTAFEVALEEQAMKNAIVPPASLREEIRAKVFSGNAARVIPMEAGAAVRSFGMLKFVAAASIVLLIGSVIWNMSLYNKSSKLEQDYLSAISKLDSTSSRISSMENDLAKIQQNPNVRMAAMKGLEASPKSVATVYWDSTSQDVYLLVNNLPEPASDKQYQLWALLDGKPIDVGMVPNEYFIGQKQLLLHMKNVSGAQAFAITLEKKGGNPTPQGTMYVLGNL